MSEVKRIPTRESYGHALAELGHEHPDLIVLDCDLSSATKTGIFQKAFPDRHINCGIAEANMMWLLADCQGRICTLASTLLCLLLAGPSSRSGIL